MSKKVLELITSKNCYTTFHLEYVEKINTKYILPSPEDRKGEEWKTIENFEDYEISNYGAVKSNKNKKSKELSPECSVGYYRVVLCNKEKNQSKSIHTLVAETFIPIPERLVEYNRDELHIDHIDRNVGNNHVDNLRWTTIQENQLNRNSEEKITPIIFIFINDIHTDTTFSCFSDVIEYYNLTENQSHKIVERINTNTSIDIGKNLKNSKWFTGHYLQDLPDEKWEKIKIRKLGEYVNVSSYGRIDKQGFRTTGTNNRNSYCQFYGEQIHRLVLTAFEGHPKNNKIVCHHKDDNPCNNKITNLEWTTQSINSVYGNSSKKKCINRKDVKTGEIVHFESLKDAGKSVNRSPDSITLYIEKKTPSTSGHLWSLCSCKSLNKFEDTLEIEDVLEIEDALDGLELKQENTCFLPETIEDFYIIHETITNETFLYKDIEEIMYYTQMKRATINNLFRNKYRKDSYGKHKFMFFKKEQNTISELQQRFNNLHILSNSKQESKKEIEEKELEEDIDNLMNNAIITNAKESRCNAVVQYDYNTGKYIAEYKSAVEAEKCVKEANAKVIRGLCRGNSGKFQSGGYIWKFKEDTNGTAPIDITPYHHSSKAGVARIITLPQGKKIGKFSIEDRINPIATYNSHTEAKEDTKSLKKAIEAYYACEKGGRVVNGLFWKYV